MLVSCYEQFVVDVVQHRMMHAAFAPLTIDEETLAYSANQEVGQGGHFLGAAHTLERFRECFYRPAIASTENFERWKRNGSLDQAGRAAVHWRKTLERYEQPLLDDAIDAELREFVSRRAVELGDPA